jgi:hypothetical protein
MSEDFLNSILKSKSDSVDEKIKKLTMVLDKIMEVAIKSIGGIQTQIQYFESLLYNIQLKLTDLESKIELIENKPDLSIKSLQKPAGEEKIAPQIRKTKPITIKPKHRPVSAPVNPRMALQSELKNLFSKMKKPE